MTASTWLPYKFFSLARRHPLFLNTLVKQSSVDRSAVNLLTDLQSTMKPEELLAIFHQHIRYCLPICGLTFTHLEGVLSSALFEKGAESVCEKMLIEGQEIGTLDIEFEQTLSSAQKKVLTILINVLAFPLKNSLAYQAMKTLALVDSLTGLANRNQFDMSFKNMMHRNHNQSHSFAMMVLDLDNFKWVNDTFGHQMGDLVLMSFAKVLKRCSREHDAVFRFGGDEFTLLLDQATQQTIPDIANRIRDAVLEDRLLAQFKVTCSIGCASYQKGDEMSNVFERADLALYRAKENGKNGFELSENEKLTY